MIFLKNFEIVGGMVESPVAVRTTGAAAVRGGSLFALSCEHSPRADLPPAEA